MTRRPATPSTTPETSQAACCDPTVDLLARSSEEAALVRRAAFTHLRRGRPAPEATLAEDTGLPVEAVRAALTELVAVGTATVVDRDVVAAGGLSVVPAAHRLRLPGVDLWTWCAFDAIGIPAALGVDALAITQCPVCGTALEVALPQGKPPADSPLVGWLPERPCANVQEDFCPEANLFCGRDHLERWRGEANDPAGRAYSLAGLAAQGQQVWAEMREAAEHHPGQAGRTIL
ncbi:MULTISPECIES: organomercurial lyase [unclassified Nocardioides]|uniref:organomercurial lyase n=1 Tax=unclassified Nocardioides TaxID=2615069 RepID=UPI0000570ACB|nr:MULTISPECIES: organomercurial lyase [unclassified Nocardioides]ABL79521.1 alkylmercury lyase [Nocardioides sp. JS614]